jgi:hypothetical protein
MSTSKFGYIFNSGSTVTSNSAGADGDQGPEGPQGVQGEVGPSDFRIIPDGSLAAPAIAFADDQDTGIFRSTTDQMALVANGAASMIVAESSVIVVPTLNINDTLSIDIAGSESEPVVHKASDEDTGLYFPDVNEIALTAGGSTKLSCDSSGVTVSGNLVVDNGTYATTIASGATSNHTLTLPVDDGGSGEVLTTNGSGTLTWSEKTDLTDIPIGSVSAPSIAFNGDSTAGIYHPTPNRVSIVTDSTERLEVSNTNVTIKNSTLSLHNGSFTTKLASGATTHHTLTLPVDDGDTGEVLITDGSGNLSWTDQLTASASTVTVANKLIAGTDCVAGATGATVLGGEQNVVQTGTHAVVCGGYRNNNSGGVASDAGDYSCICGGYNNQAGGERSFVGGGTNNEAEGSYGVVAGGSSNSCTGESSTISGGYDCLNTSDYAVVGGGYENRVDDSSDYSVISGGQSNEIDSEHGTIGGGEENKIASGTHVTIGGGYQNNLNGGLSVNAGNYSTVGGGQENIVQTGTHATVGGGYRNNKVSGTITSAGNYSTIGGGSDNKTEGNYSTIAGGYLCTATDTYATVGGGIGNECTDSSTTIAGGYSNAVSATAGSCGGGVNHSASGDYSTIAGGNQNTVSGDNGTIAGGKLNNVSTEGSSIGGGEANIVQTGTHATVGGGFQNNKPNGTATDTGSYSTIGGGSDNNAKSNYSTIGGGEYNATQTGTHATVGGGYRNNKPGGTAADTGSYSTIGGGYENNAKADYSSIGGGQYNVTQDGTHSVVAGGRYGNKYDGSTATNAGDYSAIGGGSENEASGDLSTVAGGSKNRATSAYSAVGGGRFNVSSSTSTFVVGHYCKADSAYSTACGLYNLTGTISSSERRFMVGNGGSEGTRSNLMSVTADGAVRCSSTSTAGADFGEYYEADANNDSSKIPVGTPIVFTGVDRKIRPAVIGEIPCGVISDTAGFIANSQDEEWKGKWKYVMVEKEIQEPVTKMQPGVEDGKEVMIKEHEHEVVEVDGKKRRVPKYTTKKIMLKERVVTKDFDESQSYTPRAERPEWNVVGLLGQCKVLPGKPVDPRWIKISSSEVFSDITYDIYLIR